MCASNVKPIPVAFRSKCGRIKFELDNHRAVLAAAALAGCISLFSQLGGTYRPLCVGWAR